MAEYKHMTEQDIQDGREITEIFEKLDEQNKKIAMVYIGALRDRQMIAVEAS